MLGLPRRECDRIRPPFSNGRVIAAVLLLALAACDERPSPPAAATPPPPPTDPSAPSGWTRWPLAPEGCQVDVPESLDALDALDWRPCPFQKQGCLALGATWATRSGWGFGGRLQAAGDEDTAYLSLTRAIEHGVWETLVLREHAGTRAPVAAFRQRLPGAGCVLGSVSLDAKGQATLVVLREHAENAPVVVLGPIASLRERAERVETFGGPDAAVLARDVAQRSGDELVVWEHEGRFAVRQLSTGRTERPEPPGQPYRALLNPIPVGTATFYSVWTGDRGSVWSRGPGGVSAPRLRDSEHSYDGFATDGRDAVWTRSRGFQELNTFSEVELWTGRISGSTVLSPRRLVTLPGGTLPLLAIGGGWAALWRDPEDVRLVRLADGLTRRLPKVPALTWDGGPGGIAITTDTVWARASLRGGPGNDIRLVARFDLGALPPAEGGMQ